VKQSVLLGVGQSTASVEHYIRALAVCNSLAELACHGTEADFFDRIGVLLSLKQRWTDVSTDARVVCDTGDETVDQTLSAVDIESIGLQNILSHDSRTAPQGMLVLCSESGTNNTTATDSLQPQMESNSVFPSRLTMPSAFACEFCLMCKNVNTR